MKYLQTRRRKVKYLFIYVFTREHVVPLCGISFLYDVDKVFQDQMVRILPPVDILFLNLLELSTVCASMNNEWSVTISFNQLPKLPISQKYFTAGCFHYSFITLMNICKKITFCNIEMSRLPECFILLLHAKLCLNNTSEQTPFLLPYMWNGRYPFSFSFITFVVT